MRHSGSHPMRTGLANASGVLRERFTRTGRCLLGVSGFAFVLMSSVSAQVTERISISSTGTEGDGQTDLSMSVSSDGRYVAFCSIATNLVPGGASGGGDIYVRDRVMGTTEVVSLSSSGTLGNGGAIDPSLTPDGRYVAFESGSNLVPSDINNTNDIYLRDRSSGTTELISIAAGGGSANGSSTHPAISADGRYVAFVSYASNLVAGDTNVAIDVFVRDRLTSTTERVDVDSSGNEGFGGEGIDLPISISADGRYVGFTSFFANLVPGDTNAHGDAFVHDRSTGVTERISLDSSGVQGDKNSGTCGVVLSSDGRYAAFTSLATNLVTGDTNGTYDVFVRDRLTATTERIDLGPGGVEADGGGGHDSISMSADGRFVTFDSSSGTLIPGGFGGFTEVYLRDRLAGTTEIVSVDSNGVPAWTSASVSYNAVSNDGRFVAFQSTASTLVPNDTNGVPDDFVHDRNASGSTSFCDAGLGGVIACPCANQPSGPGRGCDNSSATGGALLAASGIAYLSMDSLAFTTSGEKPTATSILMQGTTLAANGLVFGQGVRCVGGTLKRLYTKTAASGSITAPNSGAGDPTVSARSTALGDAISSGQSRFYLVYYRDPIVLGGCPSASSFNATQTVRVIWGL
jgi:Tol biopolymer transport system component